MKSSSHLRVVRFYAAGLEFALEACYVITMQDLDATPTYRIETLLGLATQSVGKGKRRLLRIAISQHDSYNLEVDEPVTLDNFEAATIYPLPALVHKTVQSDMIAAIALQAHGVCVILDMQRLSAQIRTQSLELATPQEESSST